MCLQCNLVGSLKLSWQMGQVPPVAFNSSLLGMFPYLWKKIGILKILYKKNYHCNEVCSSITKIATAKKLYGTSRIFVSSRLPFTFTLDLKRLLSFLMDWKASSLLQGLQSSLEYSQHVFDFQTLCLCYLEVTWIHCRCLFKIIYQCILELLTELSRCRFVSNELSHDSNETFFICFKSFCHCDQK